MRQHTQSSRECRAPALRARIASVASTRLPSYPRGAPEPRSPSRCRRPRRPARCTRACTSCERGLAQGKATESEACTECEAGKYTANPGLSECGDCDTGKTSGEAQSYCSECDVGKYFDTLVCARIAPAVSLRRLRHQRALKLRLGTTCPLTWAHKYHVQRARTAALMVQHPYPHVLIATKVTTAPLDPQVAPSVPRDDLAMPLVRHRKQAVAYASLVSTRTLKVLPSASHAQEAKHHSYRGLLFAWCALQESTAHLVTHAWIVRMGSLPLRERQHVPKPNLDSTRIPIKRSR
jgi:hypothetical protein